MNKHQVYFSIFLISILVFTILSFKLENSFQKNQVSDFECILTSEKTTYKIGESLKLNIQIKNNTSDTVLFIKSLDGSEEKRRYPYCFFYVKYPEPIESKQLGSCASQNVLEIADFIKLAPGGTFNPYQYEKNQVNFYGPDLNRSENYRNKGKYKIQFFYSTK